MLATFPILGYYFKEVNINGILINMLAIPLVTFVIMPLLFLQAIFWHFNIAWFEYFLNLSIECLTASAEKFCFLASLKITPILFCSGLYILLSNVAVWVLGMGGRRFYRISLLMWLIAVLIMFFSFVKPLILIHRDYLGVVQENTLHIVSFKRQNRFIKRSWQQVVRCNNVLWHKIVKGANCKDVRHACLEFMDDSLLKRLENAIQSHKKDDRWQTEIVCYLKSD